MPLPMARARRQPPLFEFLGGPDRRAIPPSSGGAASASPGNGSPRPGVLPEQPRRPVEVPIRLVGADPRADGEGRASSLKGPSPRRRNWLFWGGISLASVALLGLLVWNLAYRFGRQDAQAELKPYVEPKPAPGGTEGPSPNPQSAANTPIKVLPATDPKTSDPASSQERPAETAFKPEPTRSPEKTAAPATVTGDPRKNGLNYLELATLTYRDGTQAVEFLSRNGVAAALVPAQKGVDPAKAAANNAPHVLFVADGVPSDRFKSSERDRQKLEDKVEQLGKRFQREQKGPTDFSRPMWRLYREGKN